ncbi:MAG: hybrid sensor histidine kinase/response regulator [Oscillatoriales cyanobacterium]|nr:MAG: hybrid sensor histidine kinase/response regulator [Oscillatoriales cyanobacterium]
MTRKILIIEDDVSLLENLGLSLKLNGFQVLTANNGRSGIELALLAQPDLILCDVIMPDVGGYDVIRHLSNDVRTAHIAFIFMTAKSTPQDVREGMKLGADDYITKPFLMGDLISAIDARLAKRDRLRQLGHAEIERLCESLAHTLPYQLNSPLTGILGAADLICDLDDDEMSLPEIRDLMGIIISSAGQLKQFNQRLLNYVSLKLLKIDPLRLQSDVSDLHIAMIQPLVNRLVWSCAKEHDRLEDVRLELQNGYVAISDYWLQQMMYELIENALKFSSIGTPIHLVCSFLATGICSISIVNWHDFIEPNQTNHTPLFCRADHLRNGRGGAGIGLAMVTILLELYGGSLDYAQDDSKVCVTVTLPALDVQEIELADAKPENDHPPIASYPRI